MGATDIVIYITIGIFVIGSGVLIFLLNRPSDEVEDNQEDQMQ